MLNNPDLQIPEECFKQPLCHSYLFKEKEWRSADAIDFVLSTEDKKYLDKFHSKSNDEEFF